MTITIIVLVFILVSVLFVAAELYVLIRELGHFIRLYPGGREGHESPTGQTINVNLSSASPAGQAVRVSEDTGGRVTVSAPDSPVAAGLDEKKSGEESPQAEARPGEKGGAFAVKCPRCHAENSSYRVECFNCGNPL